MSDASSTLKDSSVKAGSDSAIFSRPVAWPLGLAIVLPVLSLGLLAWQWYLPDYFQMLRVGWILVASVIPGLYLMIIIGSISQFKIRPWTSTISLILGFTAWGVCFWILQNVREWAAALLK